MTGTAARLAGVVALLAGLYALLLSSQPNAGDLGNLKVLANSQGYAAVFTIGVGVLIVSGGIDLSIGSVIALAGVGYGLMVGAGVHPLGALALTLLGGAAVGLLHGLIATRLGVQPFLVTLCGLFVYRGVTRLLSGSPVGLASVKKAAPDAAAWLDRLRFVLVGKDAEEALVFPGMFAVMLAVLVAAAVLLHFSVYGRHWFAVGGNEAAARYAGVPTGPARVGPFALCSTLAALAGVMLFFDKSSVSPEASGGTLELYAIAGAVLGGCSLRGGDGTAVGMALGAAVFPLVRKWVVFQGIGDTVMPLIVGATLLVGAVADEALRRATR